jgi:hypothetical protein
LAARTGQNEIAELLLEKGADLFSSDTISSFKLSSTQ